jgi:hypothetical protein
MQKIAFMLLNWLYQWSQFFSSHLLQYSTVFTDMFAISVAYPKESRSCTLLLTLHKCASTRLLLSINRPTLQIWPLQTLKGRRFQWKRCIDSGEGYFEEDEVLLTH